MANIGEKVGGAAEAVKGLRRKVKSILKFSKTLVGKLIFGLIAILLIVLLVYIIVATLMRSVAQLVGLEYGIQSRNESYAFLKNLTDSGYDAMLNSKDLVEYAAFEYAVLMDAARFLEETGTVELKVENKATLDMEALGSLGEPEKREIWAALAAAALTGESQTSPVATAAASRAASAQNRVLQQQAQQAQQTPSSSSSNGTNYNNGFINTADFDTNHSEENLFYSSTYNEYTGETALNPYLKITKTYDIVKYFIEVRTGTGGTFSEDALSQGSNYNLGAIGDPSAPISSVGGQRFEIGHNSGYMGYDAACGYFLNNIYPSQICAELNANNSSAYGNKSAQYNREPVKADLYKNYSESLYYSTESVPTEHIIPLKMLLDRFLPNAVLLSSWRILRDDSQDTEDIVDEIQKIYTEACLEDETSSGDKLLVKDVHTVSVTIDETTNATYLLDKNTSQDNAKENYLTGGKTNLLYNSYEALFDSRIWQTNTNTGNTQEPTATPNTNGAITQSFAGGFSGDVIDDIKLVLTHYSENNNINLNSTTYEQVIKDAQRIINPREDIPISTNDANSDNGQYILYTPLPSGKYLLKCTATDDDTEFRRHYNLSNNVDVSDKEKIMKENNHQGYRDPYAETDDIKECFVPFLKVAFTQENGLRITSVIIHNNGVYTGYVVKGKEIIDYSSISNKNTFAYFESHDVKSTNPRHWLFATEGESSEERWVVTDAFEGLAVSIGNVSVTIKYTQGDEVKSTTITASLDTWQKYVGGSSSGSSSLSQLKVNGIQVKEENILPAGSLAIVRQNADPEDRNYTDEMLYLPTDASLSNSEVGNYAYSSNAITGGETGVTTKAYINLKSLGLTAEDPISVTGYSAGNAISLDRGKLEKLLYIKLYESNFNFSLLNSNVVIDRVTSQAAVDGISYEESIISVRPEVEYAVVFPIERRIITIQQEFWDKSMRFYLVKGAKTWSGIKMFNNKITVEGEYVNRDNYMYLISSNPYCKGLYTYETTQNVQWRCKLFAPVFAGDNSANTSARETDIQLIMSEWLEAGDMGIQAADYYIRDLYALINYSKGIKNEDGTYAIEPTYREDGTPYINAGSYTYLHIPEEIIQFDESSAEKAFFEDRLLCTPDDDVDDSTENYLRSRATTFTWQIVDYDLYEECRNADGTSSVYPLWLFGDQMSRSIYSISANNSDDENDRILGENGWGGFSDFHKAADLYGRTMSARIYNTVFDEDGNARIKASYNNGEVTLSGTASTSGAGLYNRDSEVTLRLGNSRYTFKGIAAAAYGYELYRQTLILKDPDKAEEAIKKQLDKEQKWTEVRAVAPGIVEIVKGSPTAGFYVKIRHTDTKTSGYSHMKRFPLVQVGQYVGAGTVLGYEGTTGNSNGYHTHLDFSDGNEKLNPVDYLYPFFTPFYYEEKAEEADYALDSDYMSLTRTVFPYGQIVDTDLPQWDDAYDEDLLVLKDDEGNNPKTAFLNEDNTVKIRNYVPYKTFIEDSSELLNENSGSEYYKDYTKLATTNVRTDLGGSDYEGEDIETNPDYFDEDFIKAVRENEGKITGAKAMMLQSRAAN